MNKGVFILTSLLACSCFIHIFAQCADYQIREEEVGFKSADFLLQGTITFPQRESQEKAPGIVLVHGSGPNDRDETMDIGGIRIKPFKELAEGLSRKGFVVLRYDKRTFTLSKNNLKAELDCVSPDDFIKDAKSAIEYLKGINDVDTKNIFLVGHSQGGSLAPYILEGESLRGAVLIAPGILPFRDGLIYQTRYQIKVYEDLDKNGEFSQEILRMNSFLREVESVFKSIDNGTFPREGYILGVKLPFYERLQELTHDVPGEIINIKVPVLIINGTKDMLCPYELLKEWESFLRIKPDLDIVYIDGMIHQMYKQGSADFESLLTETITSWINRLSYVEDR